MWLCYLYVVAINIKKQIEYWLTTAEQDLASARRLLKSGKDLHWCLFFCHLTIEKYLKALTVKHTKDLAPRTHDLEKLAARSDLELSIEEKDFLAEMTGYNLETRYPDEQLKIYKRATTSVAKNLMKRTEEFVTWIRRLVKH